MYTPRYAYLFAVLATPEPSHTKCRRPVWARKPSCVFFYEGLLI